MLPQGLQASEFSASLSAATATVLPIGGRGIEWRVAIEGQAAATVTVYAQLLKASGLGAEGERAGAVVPAGTAVVLDTDGNGTFNLTTSDETLYTVLADATFSATIVCSPMSPDETVVTTSSTSAATDNADEEAGAMMAQYPLVLTLAGFKSNCLNSTVFPLSIRVGPGVATISGKYNSTSATGNNENHVQIPDVVMPWGTGSVAYGYNQMGVSLLCSGSSSTANVFSGQAMWMVSDATGTPAPAFVTDPRGHRHVTLGHLIAGTIPSAPVTAGGGIQVTAHWPMPSTLRGGARLALKTDGVADDVVILFPGDLSDPKLCVVCHGAGASSESMINSSLSVTSAQNYQYGQEPLIKTLLANGYIVAASRGATTTEWGNQLSYQMVQTMVEELRQRFTFSKSVILSVSMGGLTGLRLLAEDEAFTHWYGTDPVCDVDAMAVSPSVTTGEMRKRHSTFLSAITTAHGGSPPAATNPMLYATSVWTGKKMKGSVVGPDTTSTTLSEGCDGVVAPFYNWDALKVRAAAGGATTATIRGTDTGSAGSDHGRMGNLIVSDVMTHFDS